MFHAAIGGTDTVAIAAEIGHDNVESPGQRLGGLVLAGQRLRVAVEQQLGGPVPPWRRRCPHRRADPPGLEAGEQAAVRGQRPRRRQRRCHALRARVWRTADTNGVPSPAAAADMNRRRSIVMGGPFCRLAGTFDAGAKGHPTAQACAAGTPQAPALRVAPVVHRVDGAPPASGRQFLGDLDIGSPRIRQKRDSSSENS